MAVNGLYARGLFSASSMGTEGLYARGLFGAGAGVATDDEFADRRGVLWRRRHGGLWALIPFVLLLAGCVSGTPFDPNAEPCPIAIVYASVHHDYIATDSVDYTPECAG